MNARPKRVVVLLIMAAVFAVYLGGYAYMRLRHDFVRDATGYTDTDGKIVHTDHIRLGEFRYGRIYWCLEVGYAPLRWSEGWFWRLRSASQDGGKPGTTSDDPK